MAFSLKDCFIISREQVKSYLLYTVKPNEELVCPYCGSIYLTPTKYPELKVMTVIDGKPAAVVYKRTRYKCKDKECKKTFCCDNLDTRFGVHKTILPEYRDAVLSAWLNSPTKSIREVSLEYGIDKSNVEEWVQTLVNAFDDNVMVNVPSGCMYLGRFSYRNDPQERGYILSEGNDKGDLLAIFDDYSSLYQLSYLKRIKNASQIRQIRYDYDPGLPVAFSAMNLRGDVTIIVNRQDYQNQIRKLLRGYEGLTELSDIMRRGAVSTQGEFYYELMEWGNKIPDSYEGKAEARHLIIMATKENHLYNSYLYPSHMKTPDCVKRLFDYKAGKRTSYEAMKLQVLYDNEFWKSAIQEAGNSQGYMLQLMNTMMGSFKGNEQPVMRKPGFKYQSGLRVTQIERSEEDLEDLMK